MDSWDSNTYRTTVAAVFQPTQQFLEIFLHDTDLKLISTIAEQTKNEMYRMSWV